MQIVVRAEGPPSRKKRGKGGATPILGIWKGWAEPPTADRLGMPLAKVVINIDRFGNTTAGTIPIAMQTAIEEGKLKKGDMLLIAAVGAGFTSGAALMRRGF